MFFNTLPQHMTSSRRDQSLVRATRPSARRATPGAVTGWTLFVAVLKVVKDRLKKVEKF
jgi:hypothetical protein